MLSAGFVLITSPAEPWGAMILELAASFERGVSPRLGLTLYMDLWKPCDQKRSSLMAVLYTATAEARAEAKTVDLFPRVLCCKRRRSWPP